MSANAAPVLDIRDLSVSFPTRAGLVRAVSGVTLELKRGETLGIVGESGSGKSVTALAVLGLLPPAAVIASEGIWHGGRNLAAMRARELRRIRGNRIAMIFQEPMTSLNPVFTVGQQIVEAVRLHLRMGTREAHDYAVDMLAKVGIPAPRQRAHEYPHQLSGGMRQRVMIAMALACKPEVLIADEPTTALDVTIQAQIIDLILSLQDELGMAVLMISHDMGLIAETCDRVAVMYAGRIVEQADVERLFASPMHPYTEGLLKSIPKLRLAGADERQARLDTIGGTVPDLARLPAGCAFQPRCPKALDACARVAPHVAASAGHAVRCLLYQAAEDAPRPTAAARSASNGVYRP